MYITAVYRRLGDLDNEMSELQVVRLGSRGLLCAREVIATAALKGQAQLVQQLQRSYSTSDINR